MKNIDNESASVSSILIGLIFSLTFSSLVISFLLLQVYGVSVSGIALPNAESISGNQNYMTNEVSDNINYVTKIRTWSYVPNIGRVLDAGLGNGGILLSNVNAINDVYSSSYSINNSVQSDYQIVVRYSSAIGNDVFVNVKSDGFHIPNPIFGVYDDSFYPYPNANQETKVNIKTEFNEKLGTLIFYFNGEKIFERTNIQNGYLPSVFATKYYAGVFSETEGFTLESINVFGFTNSTDAFAQFSAFFATLIKIIAWNVDTAYLPLELNLMFIKTQLAGIIVCIVMIIRGIG